MLLVFFPTVYWQEKMLLKLFQSSNNRQRIAKKLAAFLLANTPLKKKQQH